MYINKEGSARITAQLFCRADWLPVAISGLPETRSPSSRCRRRAPEWRRRRESAEIRGFSIAPEATIPTAFHRTLLGQNAKEIASESKLRLKPAAPTQSGSPSRPGPPAGVSSFPWCCVRYVSGRLNAALKLRKCIRIRS